MRLDDQRQSDNVEDRRGLGGLGGGMRVGGLGLGGLVVLLVVSWLTGTDPLSLLSNSGDPGSATNAPAGTTGAPGDAGARFASGVLASTEDTWTEAFARANTRYPPTTLVLFTDSVDSACGLASSATGPFYCPEDRKVYLDLGFYHELDRLGAPGDFAQAYVIAHEVGHHVQQLVGALDAGSGVSRSQANAQSVRQELQADCLAGVWGYSASRRGILEAGDVEEGLTAAAAIGDDRLQKMSRGRVMPESFTHGSSADRVAAFRRGLESGDIGACGLSIR